MSHFFNRSRGPAFVIGTGRSGTHWLGHTLMTHPEIRATIEVDPIFKLVKKMAVDPSTKARYMRRLVRCYKWQMFRSPGKIYLDKSHPNIWLVEELVDAFPDAKFLGIIRHPFATISSMLEHHSVSKWHERWKEFPVPNPFLGITRDIAATYESLSPAEKCALRWRSHLERMNAVVTRFPQQVHLLYYESLAGNPAGELERLQSFLNLRQPIDAPEIKFASLEKWKSNISTNDVDAVSKLLKLTPGDYDAFIASGEPLLKL